MSVATKEKPGRIAHVFGGRYQEREDGTLVRLPPEPVKPYIPTPPPPPVDVDLALPSWLREHEIEAHEIFRTRKNMQKTAAGRAALTEFFARHARRRAELLARFNAPIPPGPGEQRYINSSPGCSNPRDLRAIIMAWMKDTADPACDALARQLNQEADDLEDNRQGTVSIIGAGSPEALRGKLLAKHWAMVAAIRRVAIGACSNLAATYTDEESLDNGLKAVREKVEVEAEEIFRQKIWDSLRKELPFACLPQLTYAEFRAGEKPSDALLAEFERVISPAFTGKPKRPKRYSASGPVPYEDGEIE